jgi:hypothetical protein
MERLWSLVVATGGNRWQMGTPYERLKQAEPVATGCDQLPPGLDGKEGVNGSSPLEGSAKAPHIGVFVFSSTCSSSIVQSVWSPLWSFSPRRSRS